MMQISSAFDGGNVEVISVDDPTDVRLAIRRDQDSGFYQWFYFRAASEPGVPCRFRITNAAGAAYPEGWQGYRAVASHDREHWFRVPTRLDSGELVIEYEPAEGATWYAYFAPYTMERHGDLLAAVQGSELVRLHALGSTLDGQDLDLLEIRDPAPAADGDRLQCWIIARQHPGETMAEWWMEGFLGRLLDEDDPLARWLLERVDFHVVPNMNPDGSRRGHLRTNARGVNLNRAWRDPSLEDSPEVQLVRQRMHAVGVDFCLDVHGDEGLPYNFIAGAEGIPGWSERLEALTEAFKAAYERASPDFQRVHGYPRDAAGTADLRKCTDYVAETFDCLAMTLEMPFKDNADRPDEEAGWSPPRSRRLGASVLDPLREVLGSLR